MKVPVDSIVVTDPIHIHYAVSPFPYKVIKETDKSVEITPLNEDGSYLNIDNSKTIRKSSIVAVLEKIEDFAQFKELNEQLSAKYTAYTDLKKEFELKVKQLKQKNK